MMIIIAPNSLVRQKEWTQEKEEEESGDRRNGGHTGTPTAGADAPTVQIRSGVSGARIRRKHGLCCEVLLYKRGREGLVLVLSTHDKN